MILCPNNDGWLHSCIMLLQVWGFADEPPPNACEIYCAFGAEGDLSDKLMDLELRIAGECLYV